MKWWTRKGLLMATVAGSTAGLGVGALSAQEGAFVLDQIVVTAAGFEQNVAEAPASITVIPSEELEQGQVRDLTDALEEVQGVAVTGPANEQDIHIRGLPGSYTLILVDGKRQTTRDARPNGSAGYEQSFIPPVAAIDRIEVVRGPMSSLYGSDAMGGVINIITKPVSDVWTGSLTSGMTVNEDRVFGDAAEGAFYLSGPLLPGRLGLQTWGRGFFRGEDDFESGLTGAREGDFTARLTWTPDDRQEFSLQGGISRIRRLATVGETLPEDDADLRTDHDRKHWSFTHEGDWDSFLTSFSVQQEWGERIRNERDETGSYVENPRSPRIRNTVVDAAATVPFTLAGSSHTAVLGGQFIEARLHDQNPGRRTGVDETFSVNQWAVFGESEWSLTDRFAVTTGVRLDRHEEYGSEVSPRVYGVWQATDSLTVKGGVSTGFRAPDVRQIAPGYAYTTGGAGCTYGPDGTCGVIIADPDLEAEKSVSYELGVIWESQGGFSAGATVFRTEFKDKITNALQVDENGEPLRWDEDPNYRLWRNFNVDEATIQGLELTADWQATGTLSFRASYTWTDSEQETGEFAGFPLARTPEHRASLRADWLTPVEGLDTWARATYHGSEIVGGPRLGSNGRPVTINGVEGRKYDAYTLVDVGLSYEIAEDVRLNAAVYNVFDKQLEPTDFNAVGEGRRYWLSLTKTF